MTTPTLQNMSLEEIREQLRRTSTEEAAIEDEYTTALANFAQLSERRTTIRERRDALQSELLDRATRVKEVVQAPAPVAPIASAVTAPPPLVQGGRLPHGAELSDEQIEAHKSKINALNSWPEVKNYICEIYPSLRGTTAWSVISGHVAKRFDRSTRSIAATVAHTVGRLKVRSEGASRT